MEKRSKQLQEIGAHPNCKVILPPHPWPTPPKRTVHVPFKGYFPKFNKMRFLGECIDVI